MKIFKTTRFASEAVPLALIVAAMAGCGVKPPDPNAAASKTAVSKTAESTTTAPSASKIQVRESSTGEGSEHEHKPGAHGGLIVSLGRDSYHVEALFDNQGTVRLYTLGRDETRVIDIAAKELKGFVKRDTETESQPLSFLPEPQDGDGDGRASLFVAKLPESLVGQTIEITVPNVAIDGERFRLAFTNADLRHNDASHSEAAMPKKVAGDEEEQLYLQPGGHYTLADIEANGRMTPYQKFRGIASSHDMNPKPGDRICPITETKANPKFVWVVGGKSYLFCCPPCIDEFVQNAKTGAGDLPEPESFVQGGQKP